MIKISEKYYIDTDRYNYIVVERRKVTEKDLAKCKKDTKKKVGDIEDNAIGYYSSLESALLGIWRKKKREIKKDINLEEYVDKLEKMEKTHVNNVKRIVKEIKLNVR